MSLSANVLIENEMLQACLVESGLSVVFLLQNPDEWDKLLSVCNYVPVAYTRNMMNYQKAYISGAGVEIQDLSMILYHDLKPVGVWPLCLRKGEVLELGSNEGAVLPPVFKNSVAGKSIKTIVSACYNFMELICSRKDISFWQGVEPYMPVHDLSEWHCLGMRRGANINVGHFLYIDLSMDLAAIKSCFRRSYKALINSGSRLWTVYVMGDADASTWDEFRELHCFVSGRVTRSKESWDSQLAAIKDGAAFLVYLRDEKKRMVGGGFFHVSCDEAVYAVAAYDRSLFDKPLGHVVQFHAIQEMQRRGLKWYNIGIRNYPGDKQSPSAKEIAISEFKEGFSTHFFPFYLTYNPVLISDKKT